MVSYQAASVGMQLEASLLAVTENARIGFALKMGLATGVLARVEKDFGPVDLKHRAIEAILGGFFEGRERWQSIVSRESSAEENQFMTSILESLASNPGYLICLASCRRLAGPDAKQDTYRKMSRINYVIHCPQGSLVPHLVGKSENTESQSKPRG